MKVKTGLLAGLISLLAFSPSVLANEVQMDSFETNKTSLNTAKITDLNVLYERALNGISDRPTNEEDELDDLQAFSIDTETAFPAVSTTEVSTSQLIETEEVNGQLVETYETTSFNVLQDEADHRQQLKLNREQKAKDSYQALLDLPKETWDDTYGVKSYSTVTYRVVYDDNAVRHVDMSRVTGGWTYNGVGGYQLSNRSFTVGQVGNSRFGSTSGQRSVNPWSNNNFVYGVPTAWHPVNLAYASTVGVFTTITINGRGSSWVSPHSNNIY